MNRRNSIKLMAALLGASVFSMRPASSAALQDGVIKLVVGVPPGGPTDMLARLIAPRLAEKLGANVIVENKPGGGQTIAANMVANAPADGRTLFFCTQTLAANPFVYEKLAYDAKRAFRGVSLVATLPYGLFASRDTPADDLQTLIEFFRKNPGKYNFASSGASSMPRFSGELFTRKLNLDIVHVPYAGSGPALVSLASNETQIFFSDFLMLEPLIKSGRVKPIAVAYKHRLQMAQNVPTFDEEGVKDFSLAAWFGIVAPQKTPDAIVTQVSSAINEIVNEKDINAQIIQKGGIPRGDLTAAQFHEFVKEETVRYGELISDIDL